MNAITIYHNPACGTSRNTLALIRNSGAEPTVIEYLKTLLAVAGLQDAETTVFQVGSEAGSHHFVIIDYQQRGTGFWHVGKRRQN